jgi:hypothetical protein
MPENKTKPTEVSVTEFLTKVEDPQKLADSKVLLEMMTRVTGRKPRMWGPTIVGFGEYHYRYASGHEGDACITGFSPRKAEFSIYLADIPERSALLSKLGKHRMGKSCLYVKRLDQIDLEVLEQLVRNSVETVRDMYPAK